MPLPDRIPAKLVPHLKRQFERAAPILFTGAGFSRSAKNLNGEALPDYGRLRELLWPLCFPGEDFDPDVTLQDLYEHARLRHHDALTRLMRRVLTVDDVAVPDFYSAIFSMPWARYYTLNIDNLDEVVNSRFDLPRQLAAISATSSPELQIPASTRRARCSAFI
jgi:hypothetical protein